MRSITDWFCYVGFDYHNCHIQVCVLDSNGTTLGNQRVANDVGAVIEYVDNVRDGRLIKGAAVETCCGASNFAEKLLDHEWPIELAHAGICEKMKRSPDKSDYADAHMLADLCRVGYLPSVWLPPRAIRDLRRLTRFRQQLADQRRNIKLRIRAMLREERIEVPSGVGNVWTKSWFKWLKETKALADHSRWVMDNHLADLERVVAKIAETEKRMVVATKDDAVVQKLCAIKGVGLVTAVVIRAEIGDFDRFANGKQLARYCAVTPKNASSGKRIADGGLIKAGSLVLRTMLVETAHRLGRYHPQWKALKEQLKERGKPASVAAAAVANRWVRKLFWEMREEQVNEGVAA